MTTYALAPNRHFTPATPYRTPRAMLENGMLEAYRVRSEGTMRHVALYPADSTARETAEYVSDRVEMDGASVQAVALELHVSKSTVRRYLEGLELTDEVEAGDWDGLSFDSNGEPVWDTASTEEDAAEDLSPEQRATNTGTVEVTLAGGDCEPAGTTADELEAALAASAAARANKSFEEVAENLRRVGAPDPERTAAAALYVRPRDLHMHLNRKPRSHG